MRIDRYICGYPLRNAVHRFDVEYTCGIFGDYEQIHSFLADYAAAHLLAVDDERKKYVIVVRLVESKRYVVAYCVRRIV